MSDCSEIRSLLFYKELYNYIKKRDPNRADKLRAALSLMQPDYTTVSVFYDDILNGGLNVFKNDIVDFVINSDYSFKLPNCIAIVFYHIGYLTFEQYIEYLIRFANRYGYVNMIKRTYSNIYTPSFEDVLKILKNIYLKYRDMRLIFAVEQLEDTESEPFGLSMARIKEIYRELFGAELYLFLSEECPQLVEKYKDKLNNLSFVSWCLSSCFKEPELRPFLMKFLNTNRYLPFYLNYEVFNLYAFGQITPDEYKLFCRNALELGNIEDMYAGMKGEYFSLQDLIEAIEKSNNKTGCRALIDTLLDEEIISIEKYQQLLKLINEKEI